MVEYSAVWEHDFETEDGAMEGAISEQAQASGISRHVPTDLTAVLRFRGGYSLVYKTETDLPLAPRSKGMM